MSDKMTFEQFRDTLPENIRKDKRQVVNIATVSGIEVPYPEKFYTLVHTPRKTRDNSDPKPVEYIRLPSPTSSKDLWVQKSEFNKFLETLLDFGQREGLINHQ